MGRDDDEGHVGVEGLGVGWSPEGDECLDSDEDLAMQNGLGVVMVGEWMVR
jgi:hypothetical protein